MYTLKINIKVQIIWPLQPVLLLCPLYAKKNLGKILNKTSVKKIPR